MNQGHGGSPNDHQNLDNNGSKAGAPKNVANSRLFSHYVRDFMQDQQKPGGAPGNAYANQYQTYEPKDRQPRVHPGSNARARPGGQQIQAGPNFGQFGVTPGSLIGKVEQPKHL